MTQKLPGRTTPQQQMYYDNVEASRFGLGGTHSRANMGNALLKFTDAAVTASTARLLVLPNPAGGSLFAAHATDAMTHSIRMKSAAGTDYYIMVTATATNRASS